MAYHSAPDDLLEDIFRRSTLPENVDVPLEDFLAAELGRDLTVEELKRMQQRAEAGHQAIVDEITIAEAALAVAEWREAAGLPPLDWPTLERAARARLRAGQ